MDYKIVVGATKLNLEPLPGTSAHDIEDLRWAYDGYLLHEMNIKVSLTTLKDIDDMILFLKMHRECFHVAGQSLHTLPKLSE
jgi:hypothetical protein